MGMTAPDLAALVGSRICHDLISPVGAIHNGLELLSLQGTGMSPELALISESVDSASARIRFFRLAFGAAAEGRAVSARDTRRLLAQMTAGSRLRIDWHPDDDLPRAEVQLAFLGILCLETALPAGGEISARTDGTWRLEARAERVVFDAGLWDRLGASTSDASAHLAPAHVQFALLPACAAQAGRRAAAMADDRSLSLTV